MTLWCSCLSPHCTLRLPQLHIVYLLILAPCGRVGLMMYIMYINRDLEVWPDYGSVIDEFAVKDRRLSFIWHWWHWWFWLSICHGKGSDKRRGCSFCCLHRSCFCHRSYNKHPHLAKCLMTRSDVRSLCDSWAFCIITVSVLCRIFTNLSVLYRIL